MRLFNVTLGFVCLHVSDFTLTFIKIYNYLYVLNFLSLERVHVDRFKGKKQGQSGVVENDTIVVLRILS